jgi:KDO2-lipid IV(A) lauroyltransferase
MTRFGILVLRLLHRLPPSLQAGVGAGIGALYRGLDRKRWRITLTNLGLCFPQLPQAERERIARGHFRALGRSVVDHGVLWWGSQEQVERFVRLEGLEHWQAVCGRPVILLAPHFVGLDMGGIRFSVDFQVVSMYSRQKNRRVDELLLHGRTRFGKSRLWCREDGLRPLVKALKERLAFYYLPDQDLGARDSVFVPFFGVKAATVTALPRLAKLGDAVVLPLVTRQLAPGEGYAARFYPAWEDFPSGDLEADVRRMNAFIEERVREMPEQYWWLHRRFKTRPPGESKIY